MSAKVDCEQLMRASLPFAKHMLQECGEFRPYGAYMKPSGEIVDVGADAGSKYPKSKDSLELLRDSFSTLAREGKCKATAIVFDVRVELPRSAEKSDAIQICLEHADGYSAEVFIPYSEGESTGVVYGEIFAQAGQRDIFGQTESR